MVELAKGFTEHLHLQMKQGSSALKPDRYREGHWNIEHALDKLTLCSDDGRVLGETEMDPDKRGCLLFKLDRKGRDYGRLVRTLSYGSYLVIAPLEWERDELSSGSTPVEPESVSLGGFCAHFFDLNEDSGVVAAFRRPGGEPLRLEAKKPGIEFVGKPLPDDNRNIGPLFGGSAPMIRDSHNWSGIQTIMLGREGRGTASWATEWTPGANGEMQELGETAA